MKKWLHLTRFSPATARRCLLALTICLLGRAEAFAQSANAISAATRSQITALVQDKRARTPAQQKIGSHLLAEAKLQRDGLVNVAVPNLRAPMQLQSDGRALVDIDATVSAGLLDAIRVAGGTVLGSYPLEHSVRALLPLEATEPLAARADVKFIRPAVPRMINTGSVDSEGDVAHQATVARSLGATGAGISVGVLSDSIDNGSGALAAAEATGDLDSAHTHVLSGQAGTGEGEGLAMMEIVHDLAPGAELYFATADNGEASFAQNIRNLAAAGCKVIIDDYTYLDESPFQDGVVSQAVNDVSAQGVLYFSSARNSGSKDAGTSGTWEGDFADGGPAVAIDGDANSRYHAFSSGVTKDQVTAIDQPRADLFWSDPLGAASDDYDLYVVNSIGNVIEYSDDTQNGTQDPYESVNALAVGEYIVIVKFSGAARFLHLDTGRSQLAINTAGNVRGHNASGAPNAFSIAAISANGRSTAFTGGTSVSTESFSSDGPRRMFFNADGTAITPGNFSSTGGKVFQKPDFTAADGVATTLPGSSGLNPFYGTSAAAPHAGAIAALALSHRPSASGADVREAMTNSCLDIMTSGYDRDSGAGIIMAPASLRIPTHVDFNSDGTSDLVAQNTSTNQVSFFFMDGSGNEQSQQYLSGGANFGSWKLVGSGDFDSDGMTDLIWQNTINSQVSIWLLDGHGALKSQEYLANGTQFGSWKIVAIADMNSDGNADIIWQNASTNQVRFWFMDGQGHELSQQLLNNGTNFGPWKVVGAADVNSDGIPDLIWQNASSTQVIFWIMNGKGALTRQQYLRNGTAFGAWKIAATGDYDSDGIPDLVWQNSNTTQVILWFMNGDGDLKTQRYFNNGTSLGALQIRP